MLCIPTGNFRQLKMRNSYVDIVDKIINSIRLYTRQNFRNTFYTNQLQLQAHV